jgi:capsular polysaccharide biosynthesis protein
LSEQQLDLAASARVVRYHWPICLVFVLLGLAASAGFLVLRPPMYTATSLVLLPGASTSAAAGTQGATSADDSTTASQVATSSGVLTPAGQKADPGLSLLTLKKRVKAAGVATNVLGITASGTSAAQAEALANAVARQLVVFEATASSVGNQAAVTGLRAQAQQLKRQITDVTGEIAAANARLNSENPASSAGGKDEALVASLTTEQTQLSLQLDTTNGEIAGATIGNGSNQGALVIQQASTATPPSILHDAYIGGLGLAGGLFLGVLLVLIRHRRDRRLRHRNELADGLGVPVLISMEAPRRMGRTSEWVELLRHYQPSSVDRWGVRQALPELELSGRVARLNVVSLAGDQAGLAVGPQLAVVLATLGIATDFVLDSEHESAAQLRDACNRLSAQGSDPRPNLQVWSGFPPDTAESPVISVRGVIVDLSRPRVQLGGHADTAILAISAGFGTAEHLARVAIAAADAGVPLRGIVLTNPEADDRTSGRSPQAAPTAVIAQSGRPLVTRGLAR